MLGSLVTFAQGDCASAVAITTNGTTTSPAVTGVFEAACFNLTAASGGGSINGNWYSYTPVSDGELHISSNLATNVAPNSVDTMLSVMTGTCGTLTCVGSNDDVNPAATGGNYLSDLIIPVAAGVTYYIEWANYWDGAGFDFSLTFTAISCLKTYTINAPTNTTTTSITLNWAASLSNPANYVLEYGPTGFVQGSGTTVSPTTNSVNLTGLTASTVYDYYIKSNCGATQSISTAVNSFTTAKVCPYTTGLDLPANLVGWTTRTNGPGGQGWNSTGTAGQASTPGYWIFASSTTTVNNNWLFSPAFSLQAGEQVTVSFYTRATTSARTLRVTVGGSNTTAAQTTQLAALNIAAGTVWNLNTIPVYTAPSTGIYYFGFNDNSAATATAVNMRLDTFNYTSVLGTNDFLSSKFSVYPNPVNNVINFSNTENAVVSTVEMSDMNGRVIKSAKVNATEGQISVSDLATGLYMMKITTDQGVAVKKIVKQ